MHIFKHYWLNSIFLSANNAYFSERAKVFKGYQQHTQKLKIYNTTNHVVHRQKMEVSVSDDITYPILEHLQISCII